MHIIMKSIQNELAKKAESEENFARDIIEGLITKQDIENLPTRVVTIRMMGDFLEIYMDNGWQVNLRFSQNTLNPTPNLSIDAFIVGAPLSYRVTINNREDKS